ncbi:class I SAM-dependent methyltransferase [Brachyspira hampsonii]|uniref:class I SAM-dependent methyltransferase n=1 Tax=Brachyspira hampsonii TaxID=1287055 RepID=UPI000D33AF6C|nr:class I SAM-dependent methyltransferase [Brachyspira hampsonii]PTY40508.1 hypothetical protein DQ06_08010 [Brachyspira hampsonii bv. II]
MIENPEKFDTEFIDNIKDILNEKHPIDGTLYGTINEMSDIERKFLNGIIRQLKPKKILEVGVSAGGSSIIILNAIKDIEEAKLYSIDYLKKWHFNNEKDVGFLVKEKCDYLTNKWKLYTGGVTANFIEEIGGDIDLCLLDTAHRNPGEFMDFLMFLPYMKKNAIIIIHDIMFHTFNIDTQASTCCLLFNTIKGKKFTAKDNFNNNLGNIANIGAVILDDNIMDNILEHFLLLTLPWKYIPKDEDIIITQRLFSKHYNKELIDLFLSIVLMHKNNFVINSNSDNKIYELDNKINIILNSIIKKSTILDFLFSIEENNEYKIITILGIKITLKNINNLEFNNWYIPFKKLRNALREYLHSKYIML